MVLCLVAEGKNPRSETVIVQGAEKSEGRGSVSEKGAGKAAEVCQVGQAEAMRLHVAQESAANRKDGDEANTKGYSRIPGSAVLVTRCSFTFVLVYLLFHKPSANHTY